MTKRLRPINGALPDGLAAGSGSGNWADKNPLQSDCSMFGAGFNTPCYFCGTATAIQIRKHQNGQYYTLCGECAGLYTTLSWALDGAQ